MYMCCWKGSLRYKSMVELNTKCRALNLEWVRNQVDEAVFCAPAGGCCSGAVWDMKETKAKVTWRENESSFYSSCVFAE